MAPTDSNPSLEDAVVWAYLLLGREPESADAFNLTRQHRVGVRQVFPARLHAEEIEPGARLSLADPRRKMRQQPQNSAPGHHLRRRA